MTISSIEQAALDYLRRGWSVIPVRKRDKRPAIRWQHYQNDHASIAEVHEWFRRWPDGNIAIVTGAISGLVVLDIDAGHGGQQSLHQLEQQHGPLPATLEVISGGGGRHIYFKHPGGVVRNRVAIATGIDVRADGGCIVAPPSVHPGGRQYEWLQNHAPGEQSLAVLPSWVQSLISSAAEHAGHTPDYWQQLLRQGVGEGERNNTIASISGHLFWHGVAAEVVMELMLCWNRVRCRPPLDDQEVTRTVNSINRIHQQHDQGRVK